MNTFGRRLRLHILGESHGHGVGVVLDGVPPGVPVDDAAIAARMAQRRPGSGPLVSSRQESDEVHLSTGVHQGRTTGAPVTLWILNQDVRSQDYDAVRRTPRPGHSDWIAGVWARGHHDPRGGGHYSGRLTAPLVAAAALVQPLLDAQGIRVGAHLHQVGPHRGPEPGPDTGAQADLDAGTMQHAVATSPVLTAHADMEARFVKAIEDIRAERDSLGGSVAWRADGVPPAWGDPFFDSLESTLAHLLFSVPAVKAVGFGSGAAAAGMTGSQHNDPYTVQAGQVVPATNHAGGILGGRSTGAPLWGEVTLKPTASIFRPQATVDLHRMEPDTLELKGRHDPCVAVRAVPVVRAAVELVLTDHLLQALQEGHAPRDDPEGRPW